MIEKKGNKRDFNFSHLCLVEWMENLFVWLRENWDDKSILCINLLLCPHNIMYKNNYLYLINKNITNYLKLIKYFFKKVAHYYSKEFT